MVFSEEFFKAEEREGFYISETMKRYWACCIDIVLEIDRICKKYGLTYYADYGTLLGAVRHKGYIPWDDDIDLAMKRADYQKLISVLPKELPKGYAMHNCFVNDEHKEFFMGIANGTAIELSKEHLAKRHECPFVAVIDIFPIDCLPRDEGEREMLKTLFVLTWEAIMAIKKEKPQEEVERAVCKVEEYLKVSIDRDRPMIGQLWKYANLLSMSYGEEDGDQYVQWPFYVNHGLICEKEWYSDVVYLPFENISLPAPAGYIERLTQVYGDYNVRVRNQAAHDYPSFKKQLVFLKRKVAELKAEKEKANSPTT